LDDACGIVPAHYRGNQMASLFGSFFVVVLFAVALAAAGAILSE
jgi:hypothetical protein